MKVVGYHRTSTKEQNLDRGIIAIEEYCKLHQLPLKKIYTDQQTGKNFDRPRYTVMKEDVLEKDDILIVSEIDRLGRNKEQTLQELRYYKEHGIRVMILEIPTTLVDYSSMNDSMASMMMEMVNNMLVEMYAIFAQAEIEKKEKRQREGIAAKKARNEWDDYGRPRAMDRAVFAEVYSRVLDGSVKPFELMKELGLTKTTYYRYRDEYETNKR